MALPKKNRLKHKKDIDRVFRDGRTVKGSSLFIKVLKNNLGYPRSVIVVPSKYIGLAVDRNRVKRILSERLNKEMKTDGLGRDLAVVVYRKINRDSLDGLTKELNVILLKLDKVFKGND